MAVRIEVTSQSLIVSLTGLDVVWALKRRLVINRADIVSVRVAPRKEFVSLLRLRMYGSLLPGVLCATPQNNKMFVKLTPAGEAAVWQDVWYPLSTR